MSKKASLLKWHGGDYYQADWKLSHFPEHKHYVSTCFGSGIIELSKPPEMVMDRSEVVNDLNGDLINFWSVISKPITFVKFKRMVEATPFSKMTFEAAAEYLSRPVSKGSETSWGLPYLTEPVERAAAFFVLNRQSRQGLMKDFATMSRSRTRRGMNEQVSSWLTAIEGLPEVHERIKRFVVLSDDMIGLIRREDSKDTFFYIDPPYWSESRVSKDAYQFEFSERKHVILLAMLAQFKGNDRLKAHVREYVRNRWEPLTGDEDISEFDKAVDFEMKGKFMLCGYWSELYSVFEQLFDWHLETREFKNSASSKKTKDLKSECIWMNY